MTLTSDLAPYEGILGQLAGALLELVSHFLFYYLIFSLSCNSTSIFLTWPIEKHKEKGRHPSAIDLIYSYLVLVDLRPL